MSLNESAASIFKKLLVATGLLKASYALNNPGKLHGRSVCWMHRVRMGLRQVSYSNTCAKC